jgi:hypothetical protein
MIASYDRVHWDVRDSDHWLTVQVKAMVKGFFLFFILCLALTYVPVFN